MSDKTRRRFLQLAGGSTAIALAGCTTSGDSEGDMDDGEGGMNDSEGGMNGSDGDGDMDGDMDMEPTDPEMAPRASIDRFSEEAGTLFVRGMENNLPGPDEPIDFDQGPFHTQGFGPDGETVEYYNFDVMPTAPAPIYKLVYENGDAVEDQLNIVDVIPGDDGYNDFWHVHLVTVPDDYEANTITSVHDINNGDYDIEQTNTIKNCPIVPDGSTASQHYGDMEQEAPTVEGWYDGEVVTHFVFTEDSFETMDGSMPTSPIYVSFNENPGMEGGGPASGFMTEEMSEQTHNVVATLPGDAGHSPLWSVNIYDNADFGDVSDLSSATSANILNDDGPTVNCPIVSVE